MRIENLRGNTVVTLGYADMTAEGQQAINEGFAPALNQADLKNPALLSEADIVIFHDKGMSTIIKSNLSQSETDQILGIY
jgi:hypothetical protein